MRLYKKQVKALGTESDEFHVLLQRRVAREEVKLVLRVFYVWKIRANVLNRERDE